MTAISTPVPPISIDALGDFALLLRWETRLDAHINAQVHAASARIALQRPPWLRDLVPAYASLAVFLDPDGFASDEPVLEIARRWLQAQLRCADADGDSAPSGPPPPRIEIPVRYGGSHGPDLHEVATFAGCKPEEVVARHTGGDYRVAMLGFLPGFPYLLGLDSRLHIPRRARPRLHLAAGSVAIGGAQTGIYPRESPGGWHVIGRTDLSLFDPQRRPPSLLQPGDRVRFVTIGDAA